DVAGRLSDVGLCGARRSYPHRSLFLVFAAVAMGRNRLAVWTAAGRSTCGSRYGHARVRSEWLAPGGAGAARDAGHTVGPAVVSFTSRGGIPEGSCAALAGGPLSVAGRMIDKAIPGAIGRVVATELKPATPHQFHLDRKSTRLNSSHE